MEHFGKFGRGPKGGFLALLIAAAVLAMGAAVMLLWNAVLPDIAPVSRINYWQALGLFVLCRLLFGGFRFGPRGGGHPFGNRHFREKWRNMSDEEREALKERWREKFGKK